MTEQEQYSRFTKNARLLLKNRIDCNEIKNLTYEDIDNMVITSTQNEKNELRPFISENVQDALSEDIINDLDAIWYSGQLSSYLLH